MVSKQESSELSALERYEEMIFHFVDDILYQETARIEVQRELLADDVHRFKCPGWTRERPVPFHIKFQKSSNIQATNLSQQGKLDTSKRKFGAESILESRCYEPPSKKRIFFRNGGASTVLAKNCTNAIQDLFLLPLNTVTNTAPKVNPDVCTEGRCLPNEVR